MLATVALAPLSQPRTERRAARGAVVWPVECPLQVVTTGPAALAVERLPVGRVDEQSREKRGEWSHGSPERLKWRLLV
jgi:hypothetical protein